MEQANDTNAVQEMTSDWKLFEKDGKFYKKTTDRQGNTKMCEVVKCACGGWCSKKLLNHASHTTTRRHQDFVRANTPLKKEPTLIEQIQTLKAKIRDEELTIEIANKNVMKYKIEYCKLVEKINEKSI